MSDTYSLYLDDRRDPPPGRDWKVARGRQEFISIIEKHGVPSHISFDCVFADSRLGKQGGLLCADWLLRQSDLDVSNTTFNIHSSSDEESERIQELIDAFTEDT